MPGTAAQNIVRYAVFGEDLMKKCTPQGSRKLKALPQEGLWRIKVAIFKQYPQYWRDPTLFEETWKKCHTAIEQACGRLRRQK